MPLYLVFYNTVKRRLSIAVLITTIARRSNRQLPALNYDLVECHISRKGMCFDPKPQIGECFIMCELT